MNKLIRLSKTGIEYGDYAWNFVSGCGNNIDGKCKSGDFNCWAYSITQRFGEHYPNGFKPTAYPEAFVSPIYLKRPSRILCAFMGDLFWFNPEEKIEAMMPSQKASIRMNLKGWIFTTIRQCPQHTFLFLTKQPQNLPQWSPFPDNCWVGVTATDAKSFLMAGRGLEQIEAKVKYISLEPFLDYIGGLWLQEWLESGVGINQLIIGAQTKPYKPPKIERVEEIVRACDKAGVAVFLKDNLKPLIESQGMVSAQWATKEWVQCKYPVLRQELPNDRT